MQFYVKPPNFSDFEDMGVELETSQSIFQVDDLLIVKHKEKQVSAVVANVKKDTRDCISLNKWQRNALGVKLEANVEIKRFTKDECPPAVEITLGINSKLLALAEKEKLLRCIHQGLMNKPVLLGEQKRIPFYLDEVNPETEVDIIDMVPTDTLVKVINSTTCKLELTPVALTIKRIKEIVLGIKEDIPLEKTKEIFVELDELGVQYDTIDRDNRKLKALKDPPLSHGVVIGPSAVERRNFTIGIGGSRYDVEISPGIEPDKLKQGQDVLLNEKKHIVNIYGWDRRGESAEIINILEPENEKDKGKNKDQEKNQEKKEPGTQDKKNKAIPERLHVRMAGNDLIVETGEKLIEEGVAIGDIVRIDPQLKIAYEKLPALETGFELEEVPEIAYNDIGGLNTEINLIREAIELPYLYPGVYKRFNLERPKGILLYGPPGCGKTMIAKAIANGLTAKIKEYLKEKEEKSISEKEVKSFFINVKGPELLDKYVGETEYKIRKIFERAKLRANFHTPVILFFDEMESMFRKRGSGKSSDVETTIVPQFLSMMDGVEEFSHIIVIGATNRPDMLDPAVMRPGRLDIKIKIDRPTREEAKDIFKKYLLKEFSISKDGETGTIPLAEKELAGKTLQDAVDNLTEHALEIIFDTNNFLEVSSSKGRVETFPLKNFVSGAVIKSVISRASKSAVKEIISKERTDQGLTITDIETAVKEEFVQNRDHLVENIPEMEGQELEITIHIGKEKPLDKWDIPKERPYPGARR